MPSSSSGACSARAVSAASARIGVIHNTVSGAGLLAVPPSAKRASAPSQTAYVLPAPVVACNRPDSPVAIACQTSR